MTYVHMTTEKENAYRALVTVVQLLMNFMAK